METAYFDKIVADYYEIKKCKQGKFIVIDLNDYGKLKSTLDILEIGGYIRNMKIDNANIYLPDDSFDYYEAELRAEIGIPFPPIVILIDRIPVIKSRFSCSYGTIKSIYNDPQFIEWKNELRYELRSLNKII